MSKVEIVGEKSLLEGTVSALRNMGLFHVEPATVGFMEEGLEEHIRSFSPDEKTLLERLFLEDLRFKIEELISCMPTVEFRKSYIEPLSIIDVIAKTIPKHLASAKGLCEQREGLLKEKRDLGQYEIFLGTLSSLIESSKEAPDLDFIGLTIRDPSMVGRLRDAISRITDWKFDLTTDTAEDGTLVGLITVEKDISDKVKQSLSDEHVPELKFPGSFSELPFADKVAYVRKRIAEITAELEAVQEQLMHFAQRWMPIYQRVREWIEDRLSILRATASAFETRMCFFIHGWIPTRNVELVRERLKAEFDDRVLLDEKEIREEDMERVPIILQNSPYFRPFELFTRLLPLPAYSSYDPTPFIGIFFPIFFGMILGDAGYGIVLVAAAIVMMRKFKRKKPVRDAGHILLIAAGYTILFGLLYGEFFGDLPHKLFGIEPILIDRRSAVVPMIYTTVAVGVTHILLGLVLGAITAFRKREKREAAHRLLSVLIMLGLIAVLASFLELFPALLTRPVIIFMLFLIPLLFFTGGILAPLEFLKSIGNVISYVRIMAIGLTSVLLAFVANRLGGLAGNIVIGIVVAGLLHLLNIILGVFSPTIHSLRLHYVEFFGKFIEHGGRKFEPLSKGQ